MYTVERCRSQNVHCDPKSWEVLVEFRREDNALRDLISRRESSGASGDEHRLCKDGVEQEVVRDGFGWLVLPPQY